MSEETTNTEKTAEATEKPAAKSTTKKTTTRKAAPKKPAARKTATAAKTSAKKTTTTKATSTRKKAAAKPKINEEASSAQSAAENTTKSDEKVEKMDTTAQDSNNESEKAQASESKAFHEENKIKLDDLKEKEWGDILTRAFWMVVFGILAWIAMVACLSLAFVQFVLTIIMDKPQEDIRDIMVKLGGFLNRVMNYLSFNTDDRPLD